MPDPRAGLTHLPLLTCLRNCASTVGPCKLPSRTARGRRLKEIQGKNAGAIDNEGWLHSGDKGCMYVRGCVKITGRYKELIIGAGGENIAPVPIEDNVKKLCPAVSNFMMVGDKRKFNVALVTLKAKGATGELPGGDELDGDALGLVDGVTSISLAATNPVL